MPRLATFIIADDLTGALDSVAPFAGLGMDCLVATSAGSLSQALAQQPQVLSVNIGTRELDPETAHNRAEAATRALEPHAGRNTVWMKKIDSRMKGQISAEVLGVIGVTGATRVLVCPAIPDLGRIVIDGCLQGEGVGAPIPVDLDLPGDISVIRPDARTGADLDAMVQAAVPGTLLVGARGLAGALARQSFPGRGGGVAAMPAGPVGYCIGSRDPITLAQVDLLAKKGDLLRLSAPDGVVPDRLGFSDLLVVATQGQGAASSQVSSRLAEGVLDLVGGLTTLVACGGETAAALLRAAGVGVLRVRGEVLPGLPLCEALDCPGFPALITKSGGFGPPDTLLALWQAAHRKEGQPCL